MQRLCAMFLALAVLGCGQSSAPLQRSTEDPIRLLQSPDAGVRCSAVKSLACAGPDAPGVLPALLNATEDPSEDVKRFAGVAIISFGDRAKPALSARLRSRSSPATVPGVPLPQTPPEGFLSPLDMLAALDPWFAGTLLPTAVVAARTEEEGYRVVAVRALGMMTVRSLETREQVKLVRDALKQAAKDPHKPVADEAAGWLKRIGDE
jgi:HEAT repeats